MNFCKLHTHNHLHREILNKTRITWAHGMLYNSTIWRIINAIKQMVE